MHGDDIMFPLKSLLRIHVLGADKTGKVLLLSGPIGPWIFHGGPEVVENLAFGFVSHFFWWSLPLH